MIEPAYRHTDFAYHGNAELFLIHFDKQMSTNEHISTSLDVDVVSEGCRGNDAKSSIWWQFKKKKMPFLRKVNPSLPLVAAAKDKTLNVKNKENES